MPAVGRLGQAAGVLAHGVARDPEPPGDLPQGEALDPTKVLTWRPYSPAQADQFIRADPALPFFQGRHRGARQLQGVRDLLLGEPPAHPAPSPICSRKGYAQSFRRPSGRFAPAIAKTSGWGRPRTAGGPQGEAAPSIRGADPVLAGTALRTNGPKRGAAVFHGHALHVPRRSLRPALQAVDFCSVRRCGHGQLLHGLASIQLWPARLRRSRMLCRSIVAPKAQVARQGGDIPGRIAGSVSLWSMDNPNLVVHALAVSQFVPTGCLVLRADLFLNLVGRPHTPQANATPRSTADSARGPDTRPTMALIPAGAPHADINGRSPGTERLHSQWLGGRRKSRLAGAWTTRVEATIPKVESSARY